MILLCDTRERAISITPDLLESENRPDGFFAINDETASGILYACKLVGVKVPDEYPSADSPTEPLPKAPTRS